MMLQEMLQVQNPVSIQAIEATYTPSNKASFKFFTKFAENRRALTKVEEYLSEDDFGTGEQAHEAEKLIKIFLTPLPSSLNDKE